MDEINKTGDITPVLELLYMIPMVLTGMYVWVVPALDMLAQGELVNSVLWILIFGPIVGSIAGALWPFYWCMGGL